MQVAQWTKGYFWNLSVFDYLISTFYQENLGNLSNLSKVCFPICSIGTKTPNCNFVLRINLWSIYKAFRMMPHNAWSMLLHMNYNVVKLLAFMQFNSWLTYEFVQYHNHIYFSLVSSWLNALLDIQSISTKYLLNWLIMNATLSDKNKYLNLRFCGHSLL